jgi:aspartyl aminopeptidase
MEASVRLEKAGFHKLREEDEWDIAPGGRYYFSRYACSWNYTAHPHFNTAIKLRF